MLAKHDTSQCLSQGPKSAQCSFTFCFFTLGEFTVSSLGKRLVISVSQRQGVNGSANSQQNVSGQASCCVLLLCSSWVIHNDCNSELTWISKISGLFILQQILWQFNKKVFLCSLAGASWSSKSGRDSGFSSKIETITAYIGTALDTLQAF